MLYHYARILDVCEPFLIAHRGIADALCRTPLGVPIADDHVIDPQARRHAAFLQLLRRLDALTFGPFGMTMPSWVFYDCAVMPGAFFGLGMRREQLEPWALEALEVPDDYDGLVPISQCIAIPKLAAFAPGAPASVDVADDLAQTWLLYSLESVNQVSPGFAPAGTLKLTLALALEVFPVSRLFGVTQWRSPKLDTYVDLGPIELVTAWTPAHSLPRTLTFRLERDEIRTDVLLAGAGTHPLAPPPDTLLDPDDPAALRDLQARIEAGARVRVVGRPWQTGSQIRVPLEVRA
ncbi:MAG: hypothetical protein RIT45_2189 [Pseudomonadota bacterium]|jgi:hypothetical protein